MTSAVTAYKLRGTLKDALSKVLNIFGSKSIYGLQKSEVEQIFSVSKYFRGFWWNGGFKHMSELVPEIGLADAYFELFGGRFMPLEPGFDNFRDGNHSSSGRKNQNWCVFNPLNLNDPKFPNMHIPTVAAVRKIVENKWLHYDPKHYVDGVHISQLETFLENDSVDSNPAIASILGMPMPSTGKMILGVVGLVVLGFIFFGKEK